MTMKTEHTTGRITFRANGEANSYAMLDEGGNWWLSLLMNGEQITARQEANLRRLAACWNACDSIPTDALVKAADDIAPVFKLLMDTWAERDKLAIALRELQANPNDPLAHRAALNLLSGKA